MPETRDIDPIQFIDQFLASNPTRAAIKEMIIQMVAASINQVTDATSLGQIENALTLLRGERPAEPGELSRRYAIAITDLEKVYAFVKTYIVDATPSL